MTALNGSVPDFDSYKSFYLNTPADNHFLVNRNGSLTLESANFSTSTTIEIGNVADMDFGQDSQTFFYARITPNRSEIMKVINAHTVPEINVLTTLNNLATY